MTSYDAILSPVKAIFPLDLSLLRLDLSLHWLDLSLITFLSLINKGFQPPELIELIEQEGATRFLVKKWGSFGAHSEVTAPIRSETGS